MGHKGCSNQANKLIGNIEEVSGIYLKTTIFKSSESSFTCTVSFDQTSESASLCYFYKIKSKKNFVDVFQVVEKDVYLLIDPLSYDFNNFCVLKSFTRNDLLRNRKILTWCDAPNPLVCLEAFPFLEKEIVDWIVLFSENREVSKKNVLSSLSSYLKKEDKYLARFK